MNYRRLGNSGLRISELSLGTMTFGGKGDFAKVGATDLNDARRQIDMCLDAGVNLIDTADIYSDGLSEEMVGTVLEGRRDRVLLATKSRFRTGPGVNDVGLSRHHLLDACEASLRRLKTDHIDIFYMHEWDGQTPLEETLEALDHLVRAGKVRYIACSNFSGWQLMKTLWTADRNHLARPVAQQIYYALLERTAEYELIPAALDQQLGVTIWSPLAGGLMTGKYRRNEPVPAGSRHLTDWGEPPIHDEDRLYRIIDVLTSIAGEHDVTPAEVALAWLLRQPAISSVTIGARTGQQLATNLRAGDLQLSDEQTAALDNASAQPLLYPHWHQAQAASDRLGAPELSLIGRHISTNNGD